MPSTYRVAVLGFSAFERTTLASYFRLVASRTPHYELVTMLDDADYIVADADHAPSVQLVLATERLAETVFIGTRAPRGATAWMARPIDALRVIRELDGMVSVGAVTVAQARPEPPPSPAAVEPADLLTAAPDSVPAADAVTVTLPKRAPADDEATVRPPPAAPAPLPPPPPPPQPPPPPPSALLVDDSEIALRFLESRLQHYGLRIERASSSGKAIELLARRDYDFVFIDVELGPGSELDGLALCQHIKRLDHGGAAITSAVIMVSAHQSELDRVRGVLAGCDAYLGKPLNDADLQRLMLRHGLKPAPARSDAAA